MMFHSIKTAIFATMSKFMFTSKPVAAQLRDDIQFEFHSVKMPFPVSDIMANLMPGDNGDEEDNGYVIITGGCNSLKGNERVNFDGIDLFACLSTSVKTLKFDPATDTFTELADAPHERQRHAAAVVNGVLYVLGGRDSNDELVKAIDSYNPKTNTWTTRGELPDSLVTSDLTAWAWQDQYIYVTGGFQADYTAVGTTYRLDVSNNPTTFEDMSYQPLATSDHPRGDIHAVVLSGYAYMAGGLTHTSLWCEGLSTTERYHMETDSWQVLDQANLNVGRADMAVTILNGKIVAMGGESKPDDCKDVNDPAYGSFPADHVDVLLNPASAAKWIEFETFADQRFRFAAATAQGRIYTFGGQLPFDFTCDCFPTSDLVGIGTEVFEEENSRLDTGSIAAIAIGSAVGLALLFLVVRLIVLKCNKENLERQSTEELNANKEDGVVE